jgi:hypothetical protein
MEDNGLNLWLVPTVNYYQKSFNSLHFENNRYICIKTSMGTNIGGIFSYLYNQSIRIMKRIQVLD